VRSKTPFNLEKEAHSNWQKKKPQNALDIETKFAELEQVTSFSIDSYNAPLGEIWESGEGKEYTLVLKKKVGKTSQYRKFIVQILEEVV
jgi:hypothetical protein